MKKILTITILFFSLQSLAQDALKMGNRVIGGGISFGLSDFDSDRQSSNNSNRSNFSESFNFSFSPYYGKFIKKNVMVGLRFNVSIRNAESEQYSINSVGKSANKSNSLGFGGFARKYFSKTDKFGVFVESGLDMSRSALENEGTFSSLDSGTSVLTNHSLSSGTSYRVSIDVEGGLYFFVSSRLSIETSFLQFVCSYQDSKTTSEDIIENLIEEATSKGVNINLNFLNQFSFNKLFTINYYF